MATVIINNGRNDDLEMVCEDEGLTLKQLNNISESRTVITTFESQLRQILEKIKKPEESVELCVINNAGSQELYSKFVKPDGPLNIIPNTTIVSKPQVVPRIQSVTSLAPKVQAPLLQPSNTVTYRVVPVINQNANNIPVSPSLQGIDYRIVLPTQQNLVRTPMNKSNVLPSNHVLTPMNKSIVLPSNHVLVQSPNASTPIKVSYQTVVGANSSPVLTPISKTHNVKTAHVATATPKPNESTFTDDSGKLIELTYYGSKQGNLNFGQSRGNFTFKCGQCQKILPSNIVFMKHLREHFEILRAKNKHISNLNCEYCFKAFPFVTDLEIHKEKVHLNSIFKCKFCEYSFPDKTALLAHLGKKHKPLQMPYVCKLCGYMTSVFQDIQQHFAKRHDRTKFLMCHLCLKVMADVRNFFKHCQTHYESTNLSKGHCKMCKLIFLNSQDFRDHTAKEHVIHNWKDKTPILPSKQTLKRQLPQIPLQTTNQSPAKKKKVPTATLR